jgi:hypothetical protein
MERGEIMAGGLLSRRRVVFALAAGTFAGGKRLHGETVAGATDEIGLAKVPAKVREAASRAVPGARWTGASRSVEDGSVTYELEGQDSGKNDVWVALTADARIKEVGTEIDDEKVPPVVTAALKKRFPRFDVNAAYEVRQNGKVIRYEFEGKQPRDKETITVAVTPDGKTVEIEDD